MGNVFNVGLNKFVDLSHHNENVDLIKAKESGIVGFIHKITQGTKFVDDKYQERLKQAKDLGLLVGAYHFLTAEPIDKQLNFFLDTVKKYGEKDVLLCIDWEPNPIKEQGTMSLDDLKNFITKFSQATNFNPVLYGGYWMITKLANETDPNKLLGNCPLWQAFYSSAFGYLSDIWSNWSLLQYTDGTLGPEPHCVEGIGKVDRDSFNGTLEEAKNFWQKYSL